MRWIITLLALLTIAAFGCSKATEPKPPTIKLGHVGQDHHAALYLMAEHPDMFKKAVGVYFKKIKDREVYDLVEGESTLARVWTIKVGGGSKMPAAIETGTIQIGFGGAAPEAFAIDKGANTSIIAPLQTEGDMLVMSTKIDCPATDWNSWVIWVGTLDKPLKIGYKAPVAVAKLIFERALKEEGVKYGKPDNVEKDTRIILINCRGGKNMIPSLTKKAIDGIVMNQPIPAKAVHKKLGRVICDLASLPPEGLWKNHVCCALYSRKDLLEKHPKVIKAFLKMLLFASYKMASMPKKAAEATNTWTKNGIEVESISVPSIVYTSVPSQSWVDGVKTWAKVMNEMGAFTKKFKGKKSDEIARSVCDFKLLKEAWDELTKKGTIPSEPKFVMP